MNVSSADSDAAEMKEVEKITNKVKYQATSNQLESQNLSHQAEARINELMDWFVELDAMEQQTFIRNMISDKFGRSSLKTEESIGLLSMKEQYKSYLVDGADREAMNHLRNICSSLRLNNIYDRDMIMFDLEAERQSEVMQQMQGVLQRSERDCTIKEIQSVPEQLKMHYYNNQSGRG